MDNAFDVQENSEKQKSLAKFKNQKETKRKKRRYYILFIFVVVLAATFAFFLFQNIERLNISLPQGAMIIYTPHTPPLLIEPMEKK